MRLRSTNRATRSLLHPFQQPHPGDKEGRPDLGLPSVVRACGLSYGAVTGLVPLSPLAQVRYDKDEYITPEKDGHLPFEYYFAQKSESFAQEYEWRIALTESGIDKTDEKFVFIEVGPLGEIASKVDF